MSRIAIVVPVLSNFEGFTRMVASIRTRHSYTVYVQPQYDRQVALAAAWNAGAMNARVHDDLALICNDDILFAPDTIDNLEREFCRALTDHPDVVLMSPVNDAGSFPNPADILSYRQQYEPGVLADHPDYSCFMIHPRTYFETIGMFDEQFWPAWYEDNDSHYRIRLAGKRAVSTTAAKFVHTGRATTLQNPHLTSDASKQHFVDKWGGLPDTLNLWKHPYNDPNLNWQSNYRDGKVPE